MDDSGYHRRSLRGAAEGGVFAVFIGGINVHTGGYPIDNGSTPIGELSAAAGTGHGAYRYYPRTVDAPRITVDCLSGVVARSHTNPGAGSAHIQNGSAQGRVAIRAICYRIGAQT